MEKRPSEKIADGKRLKKKMVDGEKGPFLSPRLFFSCYIHSPTCAELEGGPRGVATCGVLGLKSPTRVGGRHSPE